MNSDSKDKDNIQEPQLPAEEPQATPEQPDEGMPTGDTPTEDTVRDEESDESPEAPEEGSGALGILKGPRFAILGRATLSPSMRIVAIAVLFIAILIVLVALGFTIFGKSGGSEEFAAQPDEKPDLAQNAVTAQAGMMELKIYYPIGRRISPEVRQVPEATKAKAIAEAVVMEFLKGPASEPSTLIPRSAALIDVFQGSDGILYLNFTSSMSLNFQGDALGEFLLLRALYKSISENVYGINGVKVLIEGIESETVGGHITLKGTLGDVVSYSLTPENK